jgi:hypothetical protein
MGVAKRPGLTKIYVCSMVANACGVVLCSQGVSFARPNGNEEGSAMHYLTGHSELFVATGIACIAVGIALLSLREHLLYLYQENDPAK